jgi:hypothetical protein
LNVIERISRPSCEPLYATNTSQRKHGTILYEYPSHWVIFPLVYSSNTIAILLLNPATEHTHVRLLPRRS